MTPIVISLEWCVLTQPKVLRLPEMEGWYLIACLCCAESVAEACADMLGTAVPGKPEHHAIACHLSQLEPHPTRNVYRLRATEVS